MDDFTQFAGVNPAISSADVADTTGGLFSRLSDAVTQGIPDAAISGALSIYNTFQDYTGGDKADTASTINNLIGSDAANYYQQHHGAIDTAGFIGTALIPGSLGIKALKLAAGGEALGMIGRGFGFLEAGSTRTLQTALTSVAESGGAITDAVSAAKNANLLYSVASNAIMGVAAETAVVATMKDSPMFDNFTIGDFAKDIAMGGVMGGFIGGGIENIMMRGIVKQGQKAVDAAVNPFRIVKTYDHLGLSDGDKLALNAESIVKMPDQFFNQDFSYNWGGKKQTLSLPTSGAQEVAKKTAEKLAWDQLHLNVNEFAGGEVTGGAIMNRVKSEILASRAAGESPDLQWERVSGLFGGLKNIQALTPDSGVIESPKQYFLGAADANGKGWLKEMRSGETGKQAYYLTDDVNKAKVVDLRSNDQFKNANEAFDAGYDVVLKPDGQSAVNPKSEIFKKTPDAALKSSYYYDLTSGALSHQVFPVAGDLISKASDFKWSPNQVQIGKNIWKMDASVPLSREASQLDTSARYLWASKLDAAAFKNRTIDATDFPLLDRLRELGGNVEGVKINLPGNATVDLADVADLGQFVNQQKVNWAKAALSKGMIDQRVMQAHLNVSPDWYEAAVGGNYRLSKIMSEEAQPLQEYFKPKAVQLNFARNYKQVVTLGPDGKAMPPNYAPAAMGPNLATTQILGQHYNALIRQMAGQNVADSILGDAAQLMGAFKGQSIAATASSSGAGAGRVTSMNANYGDKADLFVQNTGRVLHTALMKDWENTLGKLAPGLNAIRASKEATAEFGVLTTALRRNPDYFYLVKEAAEEEGGEPTYRLVDREAVKNFEEAEEGQYSSLDDAIEEVQGKSQPNGAARTGAYEIKNKEVAQFLEAWNEHNGLVVQQKTDLANAMGQTSSLDARVVKAPPVNTVKNPFFAYVVSKPRIGVPTETSMITARSAEELKQLISKVPDDYEVHFDKNTQDYYKAKGLYDYDQTIHDSRINAALHRAGILGDFFPDTRAENVLQDWVQYAQNQRSTVLRTATQVKNRDVVNDLQFLADQHDLAATSQFKSQAAKKMGPNPFKDYIRTMLDMPSTDHFPLIDSLNEFADAIGKRASTALEGLRNQILNKGQDDLPTLQQANAMMDRYGLSPGYGKDFEAYLQANQKFGGNMLKSAITKANTWLATTIQRLDFISPIVNTISTPIMLGTELSSIKALAKSNPEVLGALQNLMHTQVPGGDIQFPSTIKLIYNAVRNYWNDDGALLQRYKQGGHVSSILQQTKDALGDMAYRPDLAPPAWAQKLNNAVAIGAKITGSDFHEQMTRFVSADVMRQLTDPLVKAGQMSVADQEAFMGTFVNRVQGNYVRSQRPQIFQGTVGAAIGLFQTYQFNVLQQLFRHIADGNTRALLTFGGLQTSIYGLNGLPFFDAINQHVIANAAGNTDHKDAYTTVPQIMGKQLGDWLMYGTPSAFPLWSGKGPALYSRGDINPRNSTIIPTSLSEIPAVSAGMHLAQTIYNFGSNIGNGANIGQAMLQALEHQGWNRPLAGFAQVLAGKSTTTNGNLVSAASDFHTTSLLTNLQDRLVNFGGVERMLGAKPLDEAIALQQIYRQKDYDAMTREKLESLGTAVKTKLSDGQMPDDDELHSFMANYAKAGGRIENFHSAMQRWMIDANKSLINQMASKLSSPGGRNMQMLMGGQMMEDYSTPQPMEETQ